MTLPRSYDLQSRSWSDNGPCKQRINLRKNAWLRMSATQIVNAMRNE